MPHSFLGCLVLGSKMKVSLYRTIKFIRRLGEEILHKLYNELRLFLFTATLSALFSTNFAKNFPFDPQELLVFSLMGVFCGFTGALWVWLHRRYVKFMRKSKRMKKFLEKK
jgi:hypothetical protein